MRRSISASAATQSSVGSAAAKPRPAAATAPSDSLTLTVRASAVVWMSVVRDTGTAVEMLLQPQQVRVLKAKKRFVVITGNAGGATFKVGGRDLGALGKDGIVLRNVVITREGVKQ